MLCFCSSFVAFDHNFFKDEGGNPTNYTQGTAAANCTNGDQNGKSKGEIEKDRRTHIARQDNSYPRGKYCNDHTKYNTCE